ncbi:MAG: hypothetical protein AAFR52_17045 [Pseudomonadota bacterium]
MKRLASIAAAVLVLAAPSAQAEGDDTAATLRWAFERPPAKQGYSYPDCFCTDSVGRRVEVGQTACLTINSREVMARCEQASNLVIWRQQGEGCATAPSS